MPREGHTLNARGAESSPGGGYVGAVAARAQGVETICASPLGTGPNSHEIRRRMAVDGIEGMPGVVVGDVGVGVSLVEAGGKMATVIASGVEAETSLELLESVQVSAGDIVLVHGGDLAVPASESVLTEWVPMLPENVTVVLAVSPAVDQVPPDAWIPILERTDILTMNIREADAIRESISAHMGMQVLDVLPRHAIVARRLGAMGCDLRVTPHAQAEQIPSFEARMVDTAGVGDTHVAVMCAGLLEGLDIHQACVRANAAGALMVQHPGSYPPPTRRDVDRVIELKAAEPLA